MAQHWRRLVRNIGGANRILWKEMSQKLMNSWAFLKYLGGALPKVYAYIAQLERSKSVMTLFYCLYHS